jgi:glycosyltransferase involved in cell wall biosynthesis
LKVTFFQRKQRKNGNYSIEFIFDDVRGRLADEITATVHVAPFFSVGLLRRLGIVLDARLHQGLINHVTGDITFVAAALSRKRTVLTIHDCGSIIRSRGWRRELLRLLWLSWPMRAAAIVTTVSQSSKEEILELARCPSDKLRVVPVAISDEFRYRSKSFEGGCPRILQVGTAPNKNIPRLAQALQGLVCKLVIIGALLPETEDLLVATGVDFEQLQGVSRAELVSQYEQADIVAFISTHEGFGMPIIEANIVGRPVICGNTASMPEVSGGAACVVDPYDVHEIRAGIDRIISDDEYREDLVRRGRENAKKYDPNTIARLYLEIYQEVAAGLES